MHLKNNFRQIKINLHLSIEYCTSYELLKSVFNQTSQIFTSIKSYIITFLALAFFTKQMY